MLTTTEKKTKMNKQIKTMVELRPNWFETQPQLFLAVSCWTSYLTSLHRSSLT